MTCAEVIQASLTATKAKSFRDNVWGERHTRAFLGMPSVAMLYYGLASYADNHMRRYESSIGNDYVLGVEWLNIARALRGLLNGELGALDGGTLDALLYDMAEAAGFKREALDA